jgi:hypothetical protein
MSAPASDFVAAGPAGGQSVLRFVWTVDNETLKDVNRASGMDSTASHVRGFLARLVTAWADTAEERRPLLDVPALLSEDLVYIPSPCYIFALSTDRSTIHCWYSVLVDAGCAELLEGKAGVSSFLDGTLRLFRFRTKTKYEGFTFHRRV